MDIPIVEYIIAILSGLAACIPLVIKLVQIVQKYIKEKNWSGLLDLVMDLVEEAEGKFSSGAERREWVLMMVKASADTINYDINMDQVAALVDSLCNMSKVVNAPAEEQNVEDKATK